MAEEIKGLAKRLAALEQRLGLPAKAIVAKPAAESADKRKAALSLRETVATTELARGILALAEKQGVLAEFSIKEIDPKGNVVADSCCCCCCCFS